MSDVRVYAIGAPCASVCVPKDMLIQDVTKELNAQHPTGLDRGWALSKDKTFLKGEPNPCVCEDNLERLHYLFNC